MQKIPKNIAPRPAIKSAEVRFFFVWNVSRKINPRIIAKNKNFRCLMRSRFSVRPGEIVTIPVEIKIIENAVKPIRERIILCRQMFFIV